MKRKRGAQFGRIVSQETREKIRQSLLARPSKGSVSVDGYRIFHSRKNTITEQRKVMEKHLGKKLFPTEIVHHKNGIRLDNRIENLEVMTRSQHRSLHARKYSIEWVREQLNKNIKQKEMAKIQKVSPQAINQFIKRHKIDRLNGGE